MSSPLLCRYEWSVSRLLEPNVLPDGTTPAFVAKSDHWDTCGGHTVGPISQSMVNSTQWLLSLCHATKFHVAWEQGLYALVVISSVLVSLLLFVVLVSRWGDTAKLVDRYYSCCFNSIP